MIAQTPKPTAPRGPVASFFRGMLFAALGLIAFVVLSIVLIVSGVRNPAAWAGSLLGLLFYFLPTVAGFKKRNAGAIFVLNLLLGWTVIGWIIALVWGLTKDPQRA